MRSSLWSKQSSVVSNSGKRMSLVFVCYWLSFSAHLITCLRSEHRVVPAIQSSRYRISQQSSRPADNETTNMRLASLPLLLPHISYAGFRQWGQGIDHSGMKIKRLPVDSDLEYHSLSTKRMLVQSYLIVLGVLCESPLKEAGLHLFTSQIPVS